MRLPIVIIGLGLHLGIFLEFPIPYFAIGVVAIYFLLVPVSIWDRVILLLFKKNLNIDYQNPSAVNNFHKKGILLIACVLLTLQVNVTMQSPFLKPSLDILIDRLGIKSIVNKTVDGLMILSTKAFGVTKHPVFMDSHFEDYNHIIAVSYIKESEKRFFYQLLMTKEWLEIICKVRYG
ncbi:hypothetical protein N7U66_19075 [Lacinutrix neustonica]|uniref:Uncharacterized protein n=1 Tax=Lacinutrix neustonica TaxID=2980107 RepID=A0A9E8MVP6_9FLAO|nr:hypothetical protein [Lacinutrix neustonica]WAC01921.1 hypothetical protein N7U66_19075 [Lacinutrix neustonica]